MEVNGESHAIDRETSRVPLKRVARCSKAKNGEKMHLIGCTALSLCHRAAIKASPPFGTGADAFSLAHTKQHMGVRDTRYDITPFCFVFFGLKSCRRLLGPAHLTFYT